MHWLMTKLDKDVQLAYSRVSISEFVAFMNFSIAFEEWGEDNSRFPKRVPIPSAPPGPSWAPDPPARVRGAGDRFPAPPPEEPGELGAPSPLHCCPLWRRELLSHRGVDLAMMMRLTSGATWT